MIRTRNILPALALTAFLLPACATTNLIEWSKGSPSHFQEPQVEQSTVVRAGGTVLAFPVALAWDVVTFPFQLIWDVYPYGSSEAPDAEDQ